MAEKKTTTTAEATPKTVKPKPYEAMFLFGPSAAADGQAAINLVRSTIEKHGGTIETLKKWDERKLAYEVNKQKRGTYIIAYFTAPGASITPLERDVKLNEEILRVLITDADHLSQAEKDAVEPQPIVRQEERNPWDRPGFNDDRGGRRDDRGPRADDRGPREERAPRAPRQDAAAPAGADKN